MPRGNISIEVSKVKPKAVGSTNGQFGISQRFGRTESGAGRIPFAKVTFNYLIMPFINHGATEGTGRHAGHAFDATIQIEFNRPGFFISSESIEKA